MIIQKYFILFIFFSFIGWLMEVIVGLIKKRKFINRGFLIGPVCPIYGCGCLLLYLLLKSYKDDIIILFLMSILICSLLEYFTSYFMEKIFKARWWDYKHLKFNINGRICLETMVPFGILGSVVTKFLFPSMINFLSTISPLYLNIIFLVLLITYVVDYLFSFNVISKFKAKTRGLELDNTEEVNNFVKDTILHGSTLMKRLVESFPNFRIKK